MKDLASWERYVLRADAGAIARQLRATGFVSASRTHELIYFEAGKQCPSILVSLGSAGHAYVFAELGYFMHARGYNVFILPRHGGHAIPELVERHGDALRHIAAHYNESIGVFGEGLGGYAVFYLALAHGPARSIVCQNSPAILTEPLYHQAVFHGSGQAERRRRLVPLIARLAKATPSVRLPIWLYLDFRKMVDTEPGNRGIEAPLVEAYLRDPDFDRSYPLSAIVSLVSTPPPRPLPELTTPTMFVVASRGFAPAYAKDLFARLPPIRKKLVEVDGSVFWMVSHAQEEATLVCDWFDATLGPEALS